MSTMETTHKNMFYKVIKRIFDFICALIGIIGTLPLWIIGCLLDRYAVGDQSGCFFKFFGRAFVSLSAFIARVYLANSQII